jgi:hypothetical protein
VYVGEFSEDYRHGKGKMIYSDGTSKEGYFENNVFKMAIEKADYMNNLNYLKIVFFMGIFSILNSRKNSVVLVGQLTKPQLS